MLQHIACHALLRRVVPACSSKAAAVSIHSVSLRAVASCGQQAGAERPRGLRSSSEEAPEMGLQDTGALG